MYLRHLPVKAYVHANIKVEKTGWLAVSVCGGGGGGWDGQGKVK